MNTEHASLSDHALMARLSAFCLEGRRNLGRILVDLAEVEARNAHVDASFTSMFDYCVNGLRMSHGEAARRLCAARVARRFPWVIDGIESGQIHLSALRVVATQKDAPHFEAMLREVHGKSKSQAFELCAKYQPKPDVPFSLVEKPKSPTEAPCASAQASEQPPERPVERTRVAPLSEARFELRMTITLEQKSKLEELRGLMRHQNPSGDERFIFDAALDALLREVKKKRMGKVERPQEKRRPSQPGHVAQADVREIWDRDGAQCAWIGPDGRRCTSTDGLQIDHIQAQGQGGTDESTNLRLLCQVHNLFHAKQCYGKEHVERAIECRRRQQAETKKKEERVEAKEQPGAFETAARALSGMGFAKADVRRSMEALAKKHESDPEPPSLDTLIREGIAALT